MYHVGIKDSTNKTLGVYYILKIQERIFVKVKMMAEDMAQHVFCANPEDWITEA